MLEFSPAEVVFHDVLLNKAYTQKVVITNSLKATVEAVIKPGSPERYSVCPCEVLLRPGDSIAVEVTLRIIRYAHKQRALEAGQRDVIHIRTPYFDQKFTCTFFLSPSFESAHPQTDRLSPLKRITASARAAAVRTSADDRLLSNATAGDNALPGSSLHKSVTFTPGSPQQTAQPAQERQLRSAGALDEGLGGRLGSSQTAFEAFRAQMEADRAEVGIQLGRLGLLADPCSPAHTRAPRSGPSVAGAAASENPLLLPSPARDALPGGGLGASLRPPEDSVEALRCERDQLLEENQHLSDRVESLARQLDSTKKELKACAKVQVELQARQPDVDRLVNAAVQREHAAQEDRNCKALELLLKKDEQIKRLEAANKDLHAEVAKLQAALQSAAARMEAAHQSAAELAQTNADLRVQREREVAAAAAAQAALRSELTAATAQLEEDAKLREGADVHQQQASASERQLHSLRTDLEAALAAKAAAEARTRQLESSGLLYQEMAAAAPADDGPRNAEVEELRQQVESLQGMLKALANGDIDRFAAGAAPTALFQRIKALEDTNRRLEQALQADSTPRVSEHQLRSMKAMLAERDDKLAQLQAKLAVLEKNDSQAELLQEATFANMDAVFQARVLAEQVQTSSHTIMDLQDKLAHLEAVHALAQESAMQSETELQHARKLLSEIEELAQKYAAEAEEAQSTCVKMNSRITDLLLSEQVARSAETSARQELAAQAELHQRHVCSMEERLQQIEQQLQQALADAAVMHGLQQGEGHPGEAAPAATSTAKDPELERLHQALEEAEGTIAILQAKLSKAGNAALGYQAELGAVRQDADIAQQDLLHQVRLASEDASTRLQLLEGTVKRLSNRSGLHSEVADLSGQLSDSKRAEKVMQAHLEHAEQRLEAQKDKAVKLEFQLRVVSRQLQDLRELAVAHGLSVSTSATQEVLEHAVHPGTSGQPMLKGSSSQLDAVAVLADRVEQAEAAAEKWKLEVSALKDKLKRLEPLAAGVTADSLCSALQSELLTLREQKELLALEAEQLRLELLQSAREVASARSALATKEQAVHENAEASLRKSLQAVSSHAQEVAAANKRAAEALRRADQADSARHAAEEQARQATVRLAKLKAELDSKQAEAEQLQEAASKKLAAAEAAAAASKREHERAAQEAEERKIQASILLDTVETLQVGNASEALQRVLALTAQLVTARTREALLERRASDLLAQLEARDQEVSKLQKQLGRVLQQVAEKDAAVAAASSELDSMRRAAEGLQEDVEHRNAMVQAASAELDEARHVLAATQAELAGMKAALRSAETRHAEQLSRERAEAARAVNVAKEQAAMAAVHNGDDSIATPTCRLSEAVEKLVSWATHTITGGQPEATMSLLQQMKALLLEADQRRAKAEVDARIAQAHAAALADQASALEAVLSKRTSEWEAALLQYKLLERSLKRSAATTAVHSEQLATMQAHQLSVLSKQLADVSGKLVNATAAQAASARELVAQKARGNALQRQLKVAEAEAKELVARLAAAQLEAAGACEDGAGRIAGGSVQSKDDGVKQYVVEHLVPLCKTEDSRDQLQALAAEICALKISESELLAKLASALRRADASMLLNQALQQAVESGAEELEACRAEGLPSSSPVLELSQLTAEVVVKTQQVQKLQEQLLLARQQLEATELQLKSMEVQRQASSSAALPAPRHAEPSGSFQAAEGSGARAALVRDNTELAQQVQQLRLLVAELKQASKRDAKCHAEEVERLKAEATKAAEAASDGATAALLQSHVPTSELLKAETQVVQLQAANERLQQECLLLQQHIKELEMKVAGLQDVEEVTHAAMQKLEDTLARIEKVAVVTADGSGIRSRSPAPQGSHRTAAAAGGSIRKGTPSDDAAQMSLAALSQELVKARLAEADAQRKLRVAARAEVDLRQRLQQRDERISQLKEELESRSRFSEDLKRRLSSSSTGKPPRRAAWKPAAGHPGRVAVCQDGLLAGSPSPEESMSPADCERQYLTGQVAQLRIELARSDAEIEQLQGAVAAARAAQVEPPDVQLLSKKALRAEKLADQLRAVHGHLGVAAAQSRKVLAEVGVRAACDLPAGHGEGRPSQSSGTAVGEEACGIAEELVALLGDLSRYALGCKAELCQLQKDQAAAARTAKEAESCQEAAEQLLADKRQLEARCTELQAKLREAPGAPQQDLRGAAPKTALGLCKMLETTMQGIAHACQSLQPSHPTTLAMRMELDSAQALIGSMAAELMACCQAAPSRSMPDGLIEEVSFSFSPTGGTQEPAAADVGLGPGALQKELLQQTRRAEKWKNHCKQMRKELAAVQTAFAALAQGPGDGRHAEMASLQAAAAPLHQLQLETALQAAQGQIASLQQQVAAAKAALGQEQQERAAALASMRSALAGLATGGVTEERLKEELVKALEANARTNSDLVAARAKLEAYMAHHVAQRTATHVTGLHSMAAAAQLQAGLLESQRRLEDADRRVLDLQRFVSTRLDQLSSCLEDLGSDAAAQVVASMDLLQQSADRLDQEVAQLQASHPGVTKAQLQAVLHKCRKYQQAARELQAQVAAMSAAADSERQRQQAELEAAQRDVAACREEAELLQHKVADVQAFSEAERQRMVERHVAQLRDAEQRMEAERRELRQQANDRAEAAMAAGESRAFLEASARVAEVEAQAAHSMAGLEEARARCAADLASLQLEFQRYQQQKAAEIAALEQRVVACLSLPFDSAVEQAAASRRAAVGANRKAAKNSKKRPRPAAPSPPANRALLIPTQPSGGLPYDDSGPGRPSQAWQGPAGAVACAREAEDIEAARREAHMERLQCLRAEAAAEQLQQEVERLRGRVKASQAEVKQLQEASASATRLAAECAQGREDCERLQEELAACREALKAARADSARRQRLLQQFQARLGQEGTDQFPATVMEAQRVRQEAAEVQLQQAKAGLDRKNALIKDLRKQVEDLNQQLQGAGAAGLQDKLAIAEARIAQLQAALQRKEAALKEARERAEQSQGLAAAAVATTAAAGQQAAAQAEAAEEAERQARLLARLRAEVQRKDALLKAAQNELQREKERLQAAAAAAEEVSRRESRAAKQAANDAATLRGRGEQLVACLKAAARLVLQCCEHMRSAAAVASLRPRAGDRGAPMDGVGADAIAQMVDMTADEVADLLAPGHPGSATSQESLLQAGARAQALLLQLEVALAAGLSAKAARDTVPGRDSFARSSNSALGLQAQWDGGAADALLSSLGAGVRSCQAALDAALQRPAQGR